MKIPYKGVDLSYYNGKVNFVKLKNAGYDFVIIRAGWGKVASQKDKKFEEYYKAAKDAGLLVGCYWFCYATNVNDAVNEAKAFLTVVKGKTFDLPCYYDVEDNKTCLSNSFTTKASRTSIVNTWCQLVQDANYVPGFYTFYAALNKFNINEINYEKWLARWSSSMGNCNSTDWPMWQHAIIGRSKESTIKGIVPGCENCDGVDIDICYKDYTAIQTGQPKTVLEEKPIVVETPKTDTVVSHPVVNSKNENEIILNREPLYFSSNSASPSKYITGTYFIYSKNIVNGKIRITNKEENIEKFPTSKYVTGWIKASSDIKTADIKTTETPKTYKAGQSIILNKAPIYVNSTTSLKSGTKTGTYYIYSESISNNRIRITNSKSNVNKIPAGKYVTGWINISDIK